jgi:hypothetical protein
MSDRNLSGTYIIYAVFALISIGFIARFVRETDGRKLESILSGRSERIEHEMSTRGLGR